MGLARRLCNRVQQLVADPRMLQWVLREESVHQIRMGNAVDQCSRWFSCYCPRFENDLHFRAGQDRGALQTSFDPNSAISELPAVQTVSEYPKTWSVVR